MCVAYVSGRVLGQGDYSPRSIGQLAGRHHGWNRKIVLFIFMLIDVVCLDHVSRPIVESVPAMCCLTLIQCLLCPFHHPKSMGRMQFLIFMKPALPR